MSTVLLAPMSAYRLIFLICAVGLSIGILEHWAIAAAFNTEGIYSWHVLRLQNSPLNLSRLPVFDARHVRALLIVQALAVVAGVIVPMPGALFSVSVAVIVVTGLALDWRKGLSDEGSDQMRRIVWFTLLLSVWPRPTPLLLDVGLCFLAFQACLSYVASGTAKLASDGWRRGSALAAILSTTTNGWPPAGVYLRDRPGLLRGIAWSMIALEMLFPLALILPAPWFWLPIGGVLLFHAASAALMGFNAFFWAFVSTYPAVLATPAIIARAEHALVVWAAWPHP